MIYIYIIYTKKKDNIIFNKPRSTDALYYHGKHIDYYHV